MSKKFERLLLDFEVVVSADDCPEDPKEQREIDARAALVEYVAGLEAENPIGTLFIHGSNGVGKTSMAYAMTSRMIDSGYRTVYTTGPNMFAWIRDGYGAQSQDETAMKRLDKLQSVRVLILDELDKVRPTDWVREIMSMFIDNRYRRRDELGTVVIANNPDNLSPDVVSRLMEGAVVLNQDADYRQRRQG